MGSRKTRPTRPCWRGRSTRSSIFMEQINQHEKTLVFCATQDHALAVRDLVNQMKASKDPNYCQRVTAANGALGDQYLREFQDNEKTIPTILTTSQKLSTGVDARNIRNIVLMRPIQFDDRVQANHRARHAALRREGLFSRSMTLSGRIITSMTRSGTGNPSHPNRGHPAVPGPIRPRNQPGPSRNPRRPVRSSR